MDASWVLGGAVGAFLGGAVVVLVARRYVSAVHDEVDAAKEKLVRSDDARWDAEAEVATWREKAGRWETRARAMRADRDGLLESMRDQEEPG